MAIGTSGSGRQTLTEINVTPLVDVMLVLLIIFMVTAPLIQQGVEVKLPEARAQPVNVALDELEAKLRANVRIAKDHELYLMADRKLPYGYVVEVMAAVQRAGVTNLGMITDPVQARRDEREGERP